MRRYAVSALNDLNGSRPLIDKQFLLAIYHASQMNSPWAIRATYAEMQSMGDINLIDDEVLKVRFMGTTPMTFLLSKSRQSSHHIERLFEEQCHYLYKKR